MATPKKNAPADDILNPDEQSQPRPEGGSQATPYGPQPYGIDEAAGGADSSPQETEPPARDRAAPDESSP